MALGPNAGWVEDYAIALSFGIESTSGRSLSHTIPPTDPLFNLLALHTGGRDQLRPFYPQISKLYRGVRGRDAPRIADFSLAWHLWTTVTELLAFQSPLFVAPLRQGFLLQLELSGCWISLHRCAPIENPLNGFCSFHVLSSYPPPDEPDERCFELLKLRYIAAGITVTSEHLLGHLTTFEARDGRLLSMHVAQAVRLQRSDGQSAALRDWCRALQLALERFNSKVLCDALWDQAKRCLLTQLPVDMVGSTVWTASRSKPCVVAIEEISTLQVADFEHVLDEAKRIVCDLHAAKSSTSMGVLSIPLRRHIVFRERFLGRLEFQRVLEGTSALKGSGMGQMT